jgi:hypothetical protein
MIYFSVIIKNTVPKEAIEVSCSLSLCYLTTVRNTTAMSCWSTCVSCTDKILLDQDKVSDLCMLLSVEFCCFFPF